MGKFPETDTLYRRFKKQNQKKENYLTVSFPTFSKKKKERGDQISPKIVSQTQTLSEKWVPGGVGVGKSQFE